MSGVGKGWLRGGQGVVEDPTDSTRGVDCGVACGVAIVGWSGVVRVESHCGVVWGGQGWSGVDEVTCIAIAHLSSCITVAHYRSYRLQASWIQYGGPYARNSASSCLQNLRTPPFLG